MRPEITSENEIAFFFSTNEPIPTAPLLTFISEVARIAKTQKHFGPDAVVDLVEVKSGSKTIKLSIDNKIAAAGVAVAAVAAAATMGQFALDIMDRMQQPDTRIAKCTATMMLDNGVASATIITCEGPLEELTRDKIERLVVSSSSDREVREATSSLDVSALTARSGDRSVRDPIKVPLDAGHRDRKFISPGNERHVNLVGKFVRQPIKDEYFDPEYVFVTDGGKRFNVWGNGIDIDLPENIRLMVRGVLEYDVRDELYLTPLSILRIDD